MKRKVRGEGGGSEVGRRPSRQHLRKERIEDTKEVDGKKMEEEV